MSRERRMDNGQEKKRQMNGQIMEEDKWKDSVLVKEDGWIQNGFRNRVMVGLDVKGRWMERS